ncbi:hypothetical protein AUEXF2481DRAFT_207471 [Aureobasidium subglaciale EXF-2481]|uniref:Uncharacterized protein n=1 Tax=Aureobasidium subglaciale (strain EXF-2481) TaxID=1043005 RepID=A0A074ZNT1_AURSE|nr:uncharacterized protein AUEXF2481DRAFT_207471 [Aureobasidium subglaciale EXF-2481]KEQ99996.1 hypothetical protein AUEXF2481DRAFT_207471 [Aureobasidium subglaciale EXF-2481]
MLCASRFAYAPIMATTANSKCRTLRSRPRCIKRHIPSQNVVVDLVGVYRNPKPTGDWSVTNSLQLPPRTRSTDCLCTVSHDIIEGHGFARIVIRNVQREENQIVNGNEKRNLGTLVRAKARLIGACVNNCPLPSSSFPHTCSYSSMVLSSLARFLTWLLERRWYCRDPNHVLC